MAPEQFTFDVPAPGEVVADFSINEAEVVDPLADNETVAVSDATALGKSNITLLIPVTLGTALSYDLWIPYSTVDDDPSATATAGSDYTSTNSSITVPAGQTLGALSVPILADQTGQPSTISFVGGASFSTNADIGSPFQHTCNRPAGVQTGDLLVAFVQTQGNGSWTGLPGGWTQLLDEKTPTTTNSGCHVSVYVKVVTASEPSSYTWTHGTSVKSAIYIAAYRGVDTSNIAALVNNFTANDTSSNTSIVAPSVTTTVANSRLVCAFGVNPQSTSGAAITFTTAAGMTERYDSNITDNGTTLRASLAVDDQVIATPSATGTRTSTVSNDGRSIAVSVVLAPIASQPETEGTEIFFVQLGTPKVTNSGGADADVAVIRPVSQVTIVPDDLAEPLVSPAAVEGGGVMYGWHEYKNDFNVWLSREKHLGKRFSMARFFQPTNRGLPGKQVRQIAEGIDANGLQGSPRLMLWSVKSQEWADTKDGDHDNWIDDVGEALQSWNVPFLIFIFYHEPYGNSTLSTKTAIQQDATAKGRTPTNYKLCWERIADRWGDAGYLRRDGQGGKILLGYCEIMSRAKADSGTGPGSGDQFYPGNNVIDVLCLDEYNAISGTVNYLFGSQSPPANVRDNWYIGCQIANFRNKPLVIAEFGSHPGSQFSSSLKNALGGSRNRDQWFKQAAEFMKTNTLARQRLKGFCYYHDSRWMFLDTDGSRHPSGEATDPSGPGVEGKDGWIAAFKTDNYFTTKMFDPTSTTPVEPTPTPSTCGNTYTPTVRNDATGIGMHEVSGLAASKQHSNVIWAIRDSGSPKSLYRFKTTATSGVYSVREIPISGIDKNRDFEDCFYSDEGSAGKFIYIHENMDGNREGRQTKRLYKVREPANPDTDTSAALEQTYYWKFPGTASTEVCKFDGYPTNNQNCEAIFSYPVNNGSADGIFYAVQKTKKQGAVYKFKKLSEMSTDPNNPTSGTKIGVINHNCPSAFAINLAGDRAISVDHGRHRVWKGIAGDIKSLLYPTADMVKETAGTGGEEEAADWFPHGSCGFQVIDEQGKGWIYTNS